MKKLSKVKKLSTALCLALLLSSLQPWLPATSLSAQQTATAETKKATVRLPGLLGDRVLVRRDERGIPYIEANTDASLYFAQGYLAASDRLWQMDLGRRTARGELAEIFGRDALELDRTHRTYGFTGIAEAEAAALPATDRAILEAYARGVNALIDSLDAASLPPEFLILQYKPRPWTRVESLLIAKLFFEVLADPWETDLMRALASKREMRRRA